MMAMIDKPTPKIDRAVFDKYLKIYNADIDWMPQLEILGQRLQSEPDKARMQAACTILMPLYDRGSLTDPPEKLLFVCPKFAQYNARNWFEELKKIVAQDEENLLTRKQAISFGVIDPLYYNPRARQAFNWLMDRALASDSGADEQVIKEKMEKLVLMYGGLVICNIFNKPEYSKKLGNILNWRTGYFFERLIYEVYKPHEILKIKEHDINEIKRSNPQLIKKVKV